MDYLARESTINSGAELCCEKELPTSEILKEIRKELYETICILSSIRLSLEGNETNERKIEEPKCMYDEVVGIEHMAVDCMGLSHAIMDRLFGMKD